MSDLISRKEAIETIAKYDYTFPQYMERFATDLRDAIKTDLIEDLKALPSAQPTQTNAESTQDFGRDMNVPSTDCISRQAVIDLLKQMRKDGDMVPWEGKNVFARIRKLPAAQPPLEEFEWCTDCKEYDQEKHCCHRFTKVIRQTVEELQVVRCKDCRYAKMTHTGECKYCTYLADNFGIDDAVYFEGNDYCSHAERRTDVKADKGASR